MNTTLRMKIVFRTPAGAPERAEPDAVDNANAVRKTLPPAVGPGRKTGGGSTDPKEFLAMHARLKYEQARARRWKQMGFAISVAAIGAAATVITWARHRHPKAGTAVAMSAPASPVIAPERATAGLEATRAEATTAALPVAAATDLAAPAASGAAAVPAASEAATRCADEFAGRHWHEAIDSCTVAFDEKADAAVALRIGHAQFATDHVDLAGTWANKAVELGSEDADAYVLIGHAERQAGHPKGAMAAYRRYLRASPRGWHARSVRAALRDLKQKMMPEAGQAAGPISVEPGAGAEEPAPSPSL
jgi:tetratricopeptide (TPR) repeat protein